MGAAGDDVPAGAPGGIAAPIPAEELGVAVLRLAVAVVAGAQVFTMVVAFAGFGIGVVLLTGAAGPPDPAWPGPDWLALVP